MTSKARPGVVYLVGAGPGATDLITVRGLRMLASADVVLHDALIHPELLREASPTATVISVGKRGYCVGSTKQETIHDALVRFAQAGQSVCRLKCGDPCVFGRGGEEAEALVAAGVPYEIVPGVTAATAACAAADIPLTHRAVGASVVLASGHHDPDSEDCPHDWAALASMPVIVFYMAGRHIGRIAEKLLEAGVPTDRGAATLTAATRPEQIIDVRDLVHFRGVSSTTPGESPVLFVVGDVVRYREILSQVQATGVLA
ncbi:MAG: uroporphyrinogen-III C-methyltransferase [Fimbriiglobus sp.]